MNLTTAIEKVLEEDPKTREKKYLWLFISKVLKEMGIKFYIDYDSKLPSPDSILVCRRMVLHKKNKFPQDFQPEQGVSYERPIKKIEG